MQSVRGDGVPVQSHHYSASDGHLLRLDFIAFEHILHQVSVQEGQKCG